MPKDYHLHANLGGFALGGDPNWLVPPPEIKGMEADEAARVTQKYINDKLKELICDDSITNKAAANEKAKKYLKETRQITILGKAIKVLEEIDKENGRKTGKCVYQVRLGKNIVQCDTLDKVIKEIEKFEKQYEGTKTNVINKGEQTNEDFNTNHEVDHSKDK